MSDSQDEVELEVDCSSEDDSSECRRPSDGVSGRERHESGLQSLGERASRGSGPPRALAAP
jgi:hypothetical protein